MYICLAHVPSAAAAVVVAPCRVPIAIDYFQLDKLYPIGKAKENTLSPKRVARRSDCASVHAHACHARSCSHSRFPEGHPVCLHRATTHAQTNHNNCQCRCQSNTPPRTQLSTDSAAGIRKRNDMAQNWYSMGAREGARPTVQNCLGIASENFRDGIVIEFPASRSLGHCTSQ